MILYDYEISKEDIIKEYSHFINVLFSILGNFEDCEKNNNFEPFLAHCNRISVQSLGLYYLLGIVNFLEINSVLVGFQNKEKLTHKEVKAMVFHCINIIDSLKKGVKNE